MKRSDDADREVAETCQNQLAENSVKRQISVSTGTYRSCCRERQHTVSSHELIGALSS